MKPLTLSIASGNRIQFFTKQLIFVLSVGLILVLSGCGGGGSGGDIISVDNPVSPHDSESLKISGTPETVAYYFTNGTNISGVSYHFQPTTNRELEKVTFSIVRKPKWASFNPKTGVLYGAPEDGDDGFYPISISVSDDENQTASLDPFDIEVKDWNNVSFCAARTQKDNKVHCSTIDTNIAIASQCTPWVDLYTPRLDKSTIKLHTNEESGDLESLQKKICERFPPMYDPLTKSCPPNSTKVIPIVGPPLCLIDMPIEEREKEISDGLKEEFDDYNKDIEDYKKRPDSLPGFEPLKPTVVGPDSNNEIVITIPPSINLQHTLEKQKRKLDLYINNLKEGKSFQSPNVRIGLCPELEGGEAWNKGVCFDWGDEFGDSNYLSINLEAMGMLRVNGESSAQFTVTGSITKYPVRYLDVKEQSRLWDAPAEVNEFYTFSNNARDSLQNIRSDFDEISNVVENLHNTVRGSGLKSEINTQKKSLKQYAKNQESSDDLLFAGTPYAENISIAKTRYRYPVIAGINIDVDFTVGGDFRMQPTIMLNNLLQFDSGSPSISAKANASIKPSLGTTLKVAAGLDILNLASVKVEAPIKVLDIKTPFEVDASLNDLLNNLPPKLQLGWNAKLLAGKIEIVTTYPKGTISWEGIKYKKVKHKKQIYNFPGFDLVGDNDSFLPIYCSRSPEEGGCSFVGDKERFVPSDDGTRDNLLGLDWKINDIKLANITNDNYCQSIGARRPYLYELTSFISNPGNRELECDGGIPCDALPSQDRLDPDYFWFIFFDNTGFSFDGINGEGIYDTLCVSDQ